MAIQHKHGSILANRQVETSAGVVQLDAKGYVTNEDEVDVDKLVAGGLFVDTEADPEEETPDAPDTPDTPDTSDDTNDDDDEDDDGSDDGIVTPPKYGTNRVEDLRADAEKRGLELPSKILKVDLVAQLERWDVLASMDEGQLAAVAEENELEISDDAEKTDIIAGIIEAENE